MLGIDVDPSLCTLVLPNPLRCMFEKPIYVASDNAKKYLESDVLDLLSQGEQLWS